MSRFGRWTIWLLVILFAIFVAYKSWISPSTHPHQIENIVEENSDALIVLEDRREFRIELDSPPYNRRNLPLFYPGQQVWIRGLDITPAKHENAPLLTLEEYKEFIYRGFTDEELSYSFALPKGIVNPNPEPPSFGGNIAYGAPALTAVSQQ